MPPACTQPNLQAAPSTQLPERGPLALKRLTRAPSLQEVPPETPEPALGINFARDGMDVRGPLVPYPYHAVAVP